MPTKGSYTDTLAEILKQQSKVRARIDELSKGVIDEKDYQTFESMVKEESKFDYGGRTILKQ